MSKPIKDTDSNRKINITEISEVTLRNLLTASEIRMIKNRFNIMNLSEEGLSIREIAQQARVGTDTVVRTLRIVEKNNLRRIEKKKIKTSTPWIFGKSNDN
jgi:uncharacterized protein YerC